MTDRSLNILMLAPTPFFADRGCHVRIYEEIRALQALGHRVELVTYGLGRDLPGITTHRIWNPPWYRKLAAGPSWQKPVFDIFLFLKTLKVAASMRPHLLHAHLHEGAFFGIFLSKILRLPLLFDCQGSLTTEMVDHGFMKRGGLLCRFFSLLERFINRNAALIVTSASAGRNDLVANHGVPPDRAVALIDGVDTAVFKPQPREEARRHLGLPDDAPVVAYLGLLNAYQGVDLLLQAALRVREVRPEVKFLIMGYPDVEYRLKAEELGLGGTAFFTGKVPYDAAPLYLSAADVAVSLKVSPTEANGKLFNYQACALPVVAFDTPVNREILGDDAAYAAPGSVEGAADAILSLLDAPQERQRLAAAGRARAEREHSWQARAVALECQYRRLLESGT